MTSESPKGRKPLPPRRSTRRPPPKRVEVHLAALQALPERAAAGQLSAQDVALMKSAIDTLCHLTRELEKAGATIRDLRRQFLGPKSEKTSDVACMADASTHQSDPGLPDLDPPDAGDSGEHEAQTPENDPATESPSDQAAPPRAPAARTRGKGHGRTAAERYTGAERVHVPLGEGGGGALCTQCRSGRLLEKEPSVIIRIKGVSPLQATAYELQRCRCSTCGQTLTATLPPEAGDEKYDASAAAVIAHLRYGCGFPFNRLERLSGDFGIPLPAGTQWEVVQEYASRIAPAYEHLLELAANGSLVHLDDTHSVILSADREIRQEIAEKRSERTGIFTSGMVARTAVGHLVALFFTGRQHAGENLQRVLDRRTAGLDPPIQMNDALACNMAHSHNTVLALCLVHARRNFVHIADHFPAEVMHLLEEISKVYLHDEHTRDHGMDDNARLRYHQEHSGPVMSDLAGWARDLVDSGRIEPNSSLGKALAFLKKHWEPLTLFLRVPGAPLDNNICERALKRAILHRKNSLFYRTERGAAVGDRYMSLIYTAELCSANPVDYLTTLMDHAALVAEDPGDWMPWNYTETLSAFRRDAGLAA